MLLYVLPFDLLFFFFVVVVDFLFCVFFFNDTATTEIYTLSLHDALPIPGEYEAALVHYPDVSGDGDLGGHIAVPGVDL